MLLKSIPNLLTGGNLLVGLLAIYLSSKGETNISSLLVLAAIVFDGLDGWAARRLKQESIFGKLFDSTADFVSFGLAPAFIYCYLIEKMNILILLAISIYVLASAIRLIRFNSLDKNKLIKNFEGLPTTASAGLLILLIPLFSKNLDQSLFLISTFMVLSVLMLSRIPFWKLNNR